MKCLGCYKETKVSYCLSCRQELFDGAKVLSVLPFAAPETNNIENYQEHIKRLSISGVQLKYSLHLDHITLGLTETNGQYILKPVPPGLLIEPGIIPENEHLTMQLAKQIFNIETAANALINFSDNKNAYITRRFDVLPGGQKRQQEDFAQLSNRSERANGKNYKYDGTCEEIGLLIKKYVASAMPALERFFDLLLFNYIISNGDAHLKNFSLTMLDTGEYTLTPAYDLICTRIHTPSETETALDLYEGEMNTTFYKTYGYYGREDFMELASRLKLVKARAERIINKYIDLEKEAVSFIENSYLPDKIMKQYILLMKGKISRLRDH